MLYLSPHRVFEGWWAGFILTAAPCPPDKTQTRPLRAGWGFPCDKVNTSSRGSHTICLVAKQDGHTEPSCVQMRGPPGRSLPCQALRQPQDNTAGHPLKDTVVGDQGAPSCRTRHSHSCTSLQVSGPLTCVALPGASTLGCCSPAPCLERTPSQMPRPQWPWNSRLLSLNRKLVLALWVQFLYFSHSDPPTFGPPLPSQRLPIRMRPDARGTTPLKGR